MTGGRRRPSVRSSTLTSVLESAARLQELVPDAVLVGGSAAALHAGHRESLDHDHVLADLAERYASVLDAVEASDGWATSVRASRPPVTILGSLDGIRAGIRQLRRTRPLETIRVGVDSGREVTVPTAEEMLRVKGYLVIERGQVRDYVDVVALADMLGLDVAASVLRDIDSYYDDRSHEHGSVLTALTLTLADPSPRDAAVIPELANYRGLSPVWQDWRAVVAACRDLSARLAGDD